MRRSTKKNVNLNKLKTGCSPCMSEAKKMEQKINSKSTLSPDLMFNGFDSLIGKAYPQLSRYWDMFLEQGVKTIHLAGSGPSLYATIDSKNQASLIAKTIRTKYGCSTYLVEPSIPEWI